MTIELKIGKFTPKYIRQINFYLEALNDNAAYSIIYSANTVCDMKSTGIVRRVDVLGRIVIPKELRKMLKINEGDPMEIYVEREEIVLKKYSPLLNSDDLSDGIAQTLATRTGHTVLICDRDSYIAGNGAGVKEIISRRISSAIGKLMSGEKTVVVNQIDGQQPLELTDGENYGFFNEIFMPVKTKNDVLGGIILADKCKDQQITSLDISLTSLSADFLASHF